MVVVELCGSASGGYKLEMLTTCKPAIDWAATGSMIQGIATLIGAGAVIWGAIHAGKLWKAQKRAERCLEMAERILTATHKARNVLAYIRGPMMWAHELEAAEQKLKEDGHWDRFSEEGQRRRKTAQAYFSRLNTVKDDRNALIDCLPMARALFGENLEKHIERLAQQFWIVHVNVESYIDDELGRDNAFTQKIRRAMYDIDPHDGTKNEVSEEIKSCVELIERACQPALLLEPVQRQELQLR